MDKGTHKYMDYVWIRIKKTPGFGKGQAEKGLI